MAINIFMYIYIGENANWDRYAPPLANHYPPKKFKKFYFFFHFRCILLQRSHQKIFFISISILGRSGVKDKPYEDYYWQILTILVICTCLPFETESSVFYDLVKIYILQFILLND